MAESGFRRAAVLCCVAACFSMLAVKVFVPMAATREPLASQGAARQFPKQSPQRPFGPRPEPPRTGGSHIPEARARHHANSQPATGNRSIMGQVLPVYCLGIFIYVVYILFKITTRKDTSQPKRPVKCLSGSGLSEHQLCQLKQRLEDTERALEKLASKVGPFSDGRASGEQEERLLSQLQEIARTLRESTDFTGGGETRGRCTQPQHDSAGDERPEAEGERSPSADEAETTVSADGSAERPTGGAETAGATGPSGQSDRCDEGGDAEAEDRDERSRATARRDGVRSPFEADAHNVAPGVEGPGEADEGRGGSARAGERIMGGVRRRIAASVEQM